MCMNGCGWHESIWSHVLQVYEDDVSGNIEIVVFFVISFIFKGGTALYCDS